jgi:hypothetical protein
MSRPPTPDRPTPGRSAGISGDLTPSATGSLRVKVTPHGCCATLTPLVEVRTAGVSRAKWPTLPRIANLAIHTLRFTPSPRT